MFIHGDPLTGPTKLRLRQSILEPMVEAKVPTTNLYSVAKPLNGCVADQDDRKIVDDSNLPMKDRKV